MEGNSIANGKNVQLIQIKPFRYSVFITFAQDCSGFCYLKIIIKQSHVNSDLRIHRHLFAKKKRGNQFVFTSAIYIEVEKMRTPNHFVTDQSNKYKAGEFSYTFHMPFQFNNEKWISDFSRRFYI